MLACSRGNTAYFCYAELVVSRPAVAVTIALQVATTQEGLARLSCRTVTHPGINRLDV